MKRKLIILLLLLGAGVVGAFAHWIVSGPLPEPVVEFRDVIKEKLVVEQVVKEIEVEVPGPERVVEKLVMRTKEIPVEKEVIREIVKNICDEPDPIDPWVDLYLDLEKFEGLIDGKLRRGYVGEMWADISFDHGESWIELARDEVDRTESIAETTDPLGTKKLFRKWGLVGDFGYDFDPLTYVETYFDPSNEGFSSQTFQADKLMLGVGVARRWAWGEVRAWGDTNGALHFGTSIYWRK